MISFFTLHQYDLANPKAISTEEYSTTNALNRTQKVKLFTSLSEALIKHFPSVKISDVSSFIDETERKWKNGIYISCDLEVGAAHQVSAVLEILTWTDLHFVEMLKSIDFLEFTPALNSLPQTNFSTNIDSTVHETLQSKLSSYLKTELTIQSKIKFFGFKGWEEADQLLVKMREGTASGDLGTPSEEFVGIVVEYSHKNHSIIAIESESGDSSDDDGSSSSHDQISVNQESKEKSKRNSGKQTFIFEDNDFSSAEHQAKYLCYEKRFQKVIKFKYRKYGNQNWICLREDEEFVDIDCRPSSESLF